MFEVDFLADTWRWWGSMGAALAIWPVARWVWTFDPDTTPYFTDTVRWILGLGLLGMLLAVLVAGAIIPWASEGRVAGFTRDSLLFRQGMAFSWLMWGTGAWITAIGFAAQRRPMILASVLWWWAVFFALRETMGAMLTTEALVRLL